jgi:hypothetical protein
MSHDDEFRDSYPALSDELESGSTQELPIRGVRTLSGEESEEKKKTEEETAQVVGWEPDVVDYIRRCDTKKQAIEIIDYLLKKGDLDQKKARDIKSQLNAHGLRSFGTKKEKDHYLHHGAD